MQMRAKVEKVLAEIRSILKADGMGIELIEVTEEGLVRVRLQGACATCPGPAGTLERGVERMVKEQVPEVRQVIVVQQRFAADG